MPKETISKILLIALMGILAIAVIFLFGTWLAPKDWPMVLGHLRMSFLHFSGLGGGILVILGVLALAGLIPAKTMGRVTLLVSVIVAIGLVLPRIQSGYWGDYFRFALDIGPYLFALKASLDLILTKK